MDESTGGFPARPRSERRTEHQKPVLGPKYNLIAGHEKIKYLDEARVVGLVAQILLRVDESDKRPTYAVAKSDSTGRSSGFRVYLGTIPNYSDGAGDVLLLDGVRDDSPAAKAGVKAGDKIVKIAGKGSHGLASRPS